ncbi:MAG: hypothetical protein V1648_02845 [Candidatus Aenigmatarchaeota archaeon]
MNHFIAQADTMALKDEAKSLFDKMLGSVISDQLKNFDNPEKYPKDFLDECTDFLGKFIGSDAAKKKMDPLYRKYIK